MGRHISTAVCSLGKTATILSIELSAHIASTLYLNSRVLTHLISSYPSFPNLQLIELVVSIPLSHTPFLTMKKMDLGGVWLKTGDKNSKEGDVEMRRRRREMEMKESSVKENSMER